MNHPKNWKDKLALWDRRGYYGVTWIVWDELDGGEIEGAVVGELRPDPAESDKEYAAVHSAIESFWKTSPGRADWERDGFWFENETQARKALSVGNKALAEVRRNA